MPDPRTQHTLMYLRRHRRTIDDIPYEYWTLVESRRTASGPRQHTVAMLGKLPGLDEQVHAGWEALDDLLEGRIPARQLEFGSKNTPPTPPLWREVDVRGVRVERVREFGQVYLALSLWRRLGLHTLLQELIPSGREEVPWERIACLLTVARFCAQPSELGVAERWYQRTALEDLLGVSWEKINDDRLYRGLDQLHERKEQITQHLFQRYESWFGVGFEFLLYDVTSTFFEGQVLGNPQAARGYSRDNRPDCKQVCLGLVVSPEGLPLAYEVFAGNRADVTTVEDIVRIMEEKYGKAKRIWVMDRGLVSEENIEFLRQRNAQYIVGTPKAQLRRAGCGQGLGMVSAIAAGRSGLPLRQERSGLASDFSSEDGTGASAHPGLFPGAGHVADAGNVDERQGTGHVRAAVGGRDRDPQIAGRDLAGQSGGERE